MEPEDYKQKMKDDPGFKFLTSIGWDYYNTESVARRVAEKAQERIDELEKMLSNFAKEWGAAVLDKS